ncbi:MAG: hypothetical protein ABSH53_05150 [Holophaga sp.]|jgi:anti-sigma-K factor RskA
MQLGVQLEIRTMELQHSLSESEVRIQLEKVQADNAADQRKDLALRHVYWRSTTTTIAPVVFAVQMAVFMFLFWKWKQPEAAAAFEKILVMVITGGLGWAAGRAQGGRREDRRAPPVKPAP